MPNDARERGRAWRRAALLLLLLPPAAGCARDRVPELAAAPLQALPGPGARSLYVDGRGRFWVGRPGRLVVLDGAAVAAEVATGGDAVPTVVGRAGDRLLARAGNRVLALDAETGEPMAERAEMAGVLALHARARYLYRATGAGAVLAYDPASLEPRWGWAAQGVPAGAAAGSVLGDRVYLALSDTAAAGAQVLIRDAQTGRTLSRVHFPAPVVDLRLEPGGGLVATLSDGGAEGAVLGLAHAGGDLPLRWRHTLRELGLEARPQVRSAPAARRLAVFAEGQQNGLRVLDAETGRQIGKVREAVLDAAFGPDGALYLLDPAGIRIVERIP